MGLGEIKMHKRSFLESYLISELHCIECRLIPALIDDETAVKRYYRKKTGKELNLADPQTFSEKINWYKLNDRKPLMAQCADKVGVRDYITEKGYGNCLNEIYGVYDKVSDIDIDRLPKRFVLKAAHGSHMNIIVKDKKDINWRQAKMMMSSWLRQNIYWSGREWVYKDIPKRIVAEKYLEDEHGELRDYKFFCFNGSPRFLQVEAGRYGTEHVRNFYDMNWDLMPFGKEIPHSPDFIIECPILFDEMKRIASVLCEPFSFVRVDLYQVGSKVFFGELTYFPAGGASDFVPSEYDAVVGRMFVVK